MYEIELKAHIYNREETIKILNTFANYVGFFQKHCKNKTPTILFP